MKDLVFVKSATLDLVQDANVQGEGRWSIVATVVTQSPLVGRRTSSKVLGQYISRRAAEAAVWTTIPDRHEAYIQRRETSARIAHYAREAETRYY